MTITWNIDEARATIRAQMAEANRLDEVIDDLSAETSAALARAEAAEAAETSLRHEWRDYTRAKVQEFADMQRELNSTRAEVERLRSQVVTLEALWQRAIDADLLDDPHELGNAIADASALLNYPPPGDAAEADGLLEPGSLAPWESERVYWFEVVQGALQDGILDSGYLTPYTETVIDYAAAVKRLGLEAPVASQAEPSVTIKLA